MAAAATVAGGKLKGRPLPDWSHCFGVTMTQIMQMVLCG
jgi:hypothetical protein